MSDLKTSDLQQKTTMDDGDLFNVSSANGGTNYTSESISFANLKSEITDGIDLSSVVQKSGDTMEGQLNMGIHAITTTKGSFNNNELVTRSWVEANTSSSSVVGEGTQVGEIFAWPHDVDPSGALYCDGSSYDTTAEAELFAVIGYTYGGSGNSFNVPDYRGMFHRGMDDGAGVDLDAGSRTDRGDGTTGDAVGTKQEDEFESHTHQFDNSNNGFGSSFLPDIDNTGNNTPSVLSTKATGGSETRPKNINVRYFIRKNTVISNYDFLEISGGTMTGNIDMGAFKITTSASTFNGNELVTRDWVEGALPSGIFEASEGVKRFAEYVTGRGNCRYSDGFFYISIDDEMRFVGDNTNGRLGQGSADAHFPGVALPLPPGVNAKPLKIWNNAEWNLFCLASDGNLYATGKNDRNELSVNGAPNRVYQMKKVQLPGQGSDPVKKVVFGDHDSNTIGYLTESGKFYTAGENSRGAIGNGTTTDTNASGAYLSLTDVADAISVGSWNGSVHAQSFHCLKNDGTVMSVGWGGQGQMGNGTANNTNTTWIQAILPAPAVEIQGAGSDQRGSIVARLNNGTLYGWGRNDSGVLGLGNSNETHTPTQLTGFGTVSKYWMHGGFTSLFVKNTVNEIWGAGYSDQGQLGTGSGAFTNNTFAITNLSPSLNIKELYGFGGWESGSTNTVAITDNGHIYITGDNSQGTCSNGVRGGDQLSFVYAYCVFNNYQKTLHPTDDQFPMVLLDSVPGGWGPILMVLSDKKELYGCGNGRWHMYTRNSNDINYLTKINIT